MGQRRLVVSVVTHDSDILRRCSGAPFVRAAPDRAIGTIFPIAEETKGSFRPGVPQKGNAYERV